jgi:two-component system sensor histidine kinase AlgZ
MEGAGHCRHTAPGDSIGMTSPASRPDGFLPDLCGVRPLFAIVIIGQLLVFVLVLARAGIGPVALRELALLSLYVQWIGLAAAAVLCLSRGWLSRLPERLAAGLSYALVMLAAAIVCWLAGLVVYPAGGEAALIALDASDFRVRTLVIAAIVAALVLRYFYVNHQWRQRTAAESAARLQALQARIRPHFFFNCMNTIASLTRRDPPAAERAVEDLADLFRASLSDARSLVPLAEELELVRRYLAIEALRLGPRLRVAWDIEALPPDALIPQFTLQPLVENAVYHGIERLEEGGEIRIAGRAGRDELVVEIANPVRAAGPRARGLHLAQENVRLRLAAHFGERGRLETGPAAEDGGRYVARVVVPLA